VARLCVEREILGIDRRNEVVCQRAANALGIAPAVVHQQHGVLVTDYIEAPTLTAEAVRSPEFVPRLASVLRTLHSGWDQLTGEILYFSAFQTNRTYAKTARSLGARLPEDMDRLLDDARMLAHRITPFTPVLCHNDLLAANILDDGQTIWLVDWEYAGMGHPLFDVANVSATCAFPDPLERALLAAYRGTPDADSHDLAQLRLLKTVSLLREVLWALIQTVASDIDFDYEAYAARNLEAYRRAREALNEL
jgi:thiamine kinase-like enzyme